MTHKLLHFPRTLNWEIDPKTVLLIRLILILWDEVQRQSISFPVLLAVCYDSIFQFPSQVVVKLSASTYFSEGGRKESSGDQAKELILIESIDLARIP